ncbi:MAG: NADP-dependent oxidoreductase, partial [Thermoplasmata archaeon]|nr:NADP-dependent oxidoreductase [Thermoplasmata archaeon]
GSPTLMELPRPEPGDQDLLVRMTAASVNPFDWKIAEGIFRGKRPHVFPLVLGVDGSGTIEQVGLSVTRFRLGDQVYGSFLHRPVGIGTYAEYATVPENNAIVRVPQGLDPVASAGIPTSGMTALDALDTINAPRGAKLVIVGATGGVGSFATQLAARRGLHVIATGRPDASVELKARGASEVIDFSSAPVVPQIRALHPDGVDGLLDLVSNAASFAELAALVRSGGVAATTTFVADPPSLAKLGVRGVNIDMQPRAELLERISAEILAGRLEVPVGSRIPLEGAPEAYALSRAGRARGKTLILLR